MNKQKKRDRYTRIKHQLEALFLPVDNTVARMATAVSLLHHKFDYFFWTGFYLLNEGELLVGPYQGSLACMKLKKDTGVCWAAINQGQTLIVENVHEFPGHIACDSRSNSEIVIPLFNSESNIIGVFDIDSKDFSAFDEADAEGLLNIVNLLNL